MAAAGTTTTKLAGRVAVITGASKGLGKAMALALSEAGAQIALVARDTAKLQGVQKEIEGNSGRAGIFTADVTDEAQVASLKEQVLEQLGPAQILINSAGINIRKNLVDFTLEEWRSVQDANLTSVFLMCRAFVPDMKGTGYGRVINMSSIMSHISLPVAALIRRAKRLCWD